MGRVLVPDTVGHDAVEAVAQLDRPAAHGNHEFDVQKRLAARQTKSANALGACIFEEAQSRFDVEAVGPLDRHTTVRQLRLHW